jgi:hypothetical protein
MTSYVTPKKGVEFICYVGLFSQANTKILQANPTLAAGDAKVSIDGGAFANLATLPAVTPAAGKSVKITLSTSEMNGDNITVILSDASGDEWCDLIVNIQTTARQIDDLAYPSTSGRAITVSATGEVDANVTQIDGSATSGNNATLNLAQLNIVNSGGSAIVASSTGGNGHGIAASGNGTGEGLSATGGATGHGIGAVGGATSGNGIDAAATAGDSHGLNAAGQGGGHGLNATGGATGDGLRGNGGATSGMGATLRGAAGNSDGMRLTGIGSGVGLQAFGGTTGHGIQAVGGQTSGNGIRARINALGTPDSNAVSFEGSGSGAGLRVVGGDTGHGLRAEGGATSGDGINAAATTSGDGMTLSGAGGGLDLDGAVNELTAAALAQYFTVDSGETFGTAVAGSVVRETAANATITSIGSSVLNDIADAILRRDWMAVAAPASRSVLNALRAIRNRVALAAGTMTVYEEDDATTAYTATVTTNPAAEPITEIDPT